MCISERPMSRKLRQKPYVPWNTRSKKSIWGAMKHTTMEFCIGVYCDVFLEIYVSDHIFEPS